MGTSDNVERQIVDSAIESNAENSAPETQGDSGIGEPEAPRKKTLDMQQFVKSWDKNQKIKLWLAEHGVSDVRTQDKAVKDAIARTELHKEFFIGTLDFLKDEEGRSSSPGISEKGTVLGTVIDPRTQAEKLVVVVLDKKTGKINQEQDHYRDAEKPPPLPVKKRVRNRAKNRSKQKERTAKNVQISTKQPFENVKGLQFKAA